MLLGIDAYKDSSVLFLQAFQTQRRTLHGSHLFRALHALPFFDVLLGATAAQAKLAVQLANRNTGVLDILGHASTLHKAFARQALLPVTRVHPPTLLFTVEVQVSHHLADLNTHRE